ncbi:TIM44-like domain-containing protein [Candidatus Micrarchaeota archaeon]|nr:TIM44-like domain-containing protein [Candidatus Micrarchaeota archaeon]
MHRNLVLAVIFFFVIAPALVQARGGGGCFLQGTLVQTEDGPMPIESLAAGKNVVSFSDDGISLSQVSSVFEVKRDSYYRITAGNHTVLVTAEHPFYIGNSFYKQASLLKVGDFVYIISANSLEKEKIDDVTIFENETTAYNLEVGGSHTFIANSFAVHNKGGGGGGGCFAPGTMISTSSGLSNIENIAKGDIVQSFDENLNIVNSSVSDIYKLISSGYYSIMTGEGIVNVTAEHPFLTPDGYVVAENLSVGMRVYELKDDKLVLETVTGVRMIDDPTIAYNLHVDNVHTFIANGFAVHNKGGSGGSSHSSGPPPNVFYYDCKQTAKDESGERQCCKLTSSSYSSTPQNCGDSTYINCEVSSFSCTCTNDATYKVANMYICPFKIEDLAPSAVLAAIYLGLLITCFKVRRRILWIVSAVIIVSLGIILYAFVLLFLLVWVSVVVLSILGHRGRKEWSSTTSVPRKKMLVKSKKTSALIAALSSLDPVWNEQKMKETATKTFYKLQECWQAREYSPMVSLMMPSLYNQHISQLDSMKQNHEINRLDNLKLLEMNVILIKNRNDMMKDEFTVWLKAQAKDTIVDDRTGKRIRGDTGTGVFEEFWTFQRQGSEWKLRHIDQPEEGMSLIGEENYDENSTPMTREQIYGRIGRLSKKDVSLSSQREQIPVAFTPSIDAIKSKGGKTHRMLNFLAQTDKIWDENGMRDLARESFILVNTATEQRNLTKVQDRLTPKLYAILNAEINGLLAKGQIEQKRNLTVRNVEIVLIRNYNDRYKDEFVAWISGQAQKVIFDLASGRPVGGDAYVRDFEEYYTFRRNGDRWFLDMIEDADRSEYIKNANIDEGTSKKMIDWYYSKERAV